MRLNEIQVIATHNSYHVQPEEPRFSEMIARNPRAASWGYTHAPLNEQLDSGVRGFELDVYYQPDGYFKVLHVPDFDYGTTCDTFVDCLGVIRDWSLASPSHVPIFTHIEVKDRQYPTVKTKILPVRAPELRILEQEIRSVFDGAHLLRPDDLRGPYASPREGLEKRGWPLLDEVRGKCIFILHNRGIHREEFLRGNPTLQGRALFNFAVPGEPDAAFLIRDNPYDESIPGLVRAGYIIRTRDGGPNNPSRLQQALQSGAHLISTDYPPDEPDGATGYRVYFDAGAVVRANPIAINNPDTTPAGAP